MTTCRPCPVSVCQPVFDRIVISYLRAVGAKVMWELLPTFLDAGPLTAQLQVGTTNNPDADDWLDVGLPVKDMFFAVDDKQRVWGKTNWTHYRVKLTTAIGTYFSPPVGGLGTLDRRDWRIARERFRQERVYARLASERGYILKKRVTGARCPVCVDLQTNECRNPDCEVCLGTTFQCGYYYPMGCAFAAISPKATRTYIDGETRGTINDIVVKARMVLNTLLMEEDIFINAVTDDRYFVHRVTNIGEIRGVPIVGEVELRPAPFSSIIYTIPIPPQLAEFEEI